MNTIKKLFPGLKIEEITINEMGWSSQVLILNNSYVVKIPRNDEAAESLDKEIEITGLLSNQVPVDIPNYVARIGENLVEGAAYDQLPGLLFTTQPVPAEIPKMEPLSLSEIEQDHIAGQMGTLLHSIHSIDRELVEHILHDYVKDSWKEKIDTLLLRSKNISRKAYVDEELNEVLEFLTHMEREFHGLELEEKFIHGDFAGWNMLYGSENNTITGLLDWADSRFGDPARDFTELIYDFGWNFAEKVVSAYDPADRKVMERAAFYLKFAGFQDLEYGMETGNDFFTDRGFKTIKKELSEFHTHK